MRKSTFPAILVLLGSFGCGSEPQSQQEAAPKPSAQEESATMSPQLRDLQGVQWKLQGFEPEADLEIPDDVSITMEFNDDRVAGSAGCNRYFSSFQLDGNSLELGPAGSTMMMCPPEIMELEQKFLGAFQEVAEIELTSGQLLLKKDGEVLLRFVRSAETEKEPS